MSNPLQAQIQVRYINKPKPGGKLGNIKDTGNNVFFVEPAYLSLFGVNEQCVVLYEQQVWGKGTPNERMANILVGKDGNTLANMIHGQAAPPMQAQPTPQASPQRNSDHDAKERAMFVMGVVGRAMGSGQFAIDDLRMLTLRAREAWKEAMEVKVPPHVSQPHSGLQPSYEPAGAPQASGMDDGPPAGDPRFSGPIA